MVIRRGFELAQGGEEGAERDLGRGQRREHCGQHRHVRSRACRAEESVTSFGFRVEGWYGPEEVGEEARERARGSVWWSNLPRQRGAVGVGQCQGVGLRI